jgi:hypothetical protein
MLRGGSYPRNRNERRQHHLTSVSSKKTRMLLRIGWWWEREGRILGLEKAT